MRGEKHKQKLGVTTITVSVLHTRDLASTSHEPLDTVLKAINDHPDLLLLENVAQPHVFEVELPNTVATRK